MKIPKKLNICGFEYTVEIREIDNNDIFGQHNQTRCQILIAADGVNKQKKEQTFIHEILHAIDCAVGVDLKEKQVTTLSRGLYQVLKDNNLLKD